MNHKSENWTANIEYVYEFLYNSDTYEGGASTISIHKSKIGAEIAMELHKLQIKKEWEIECEEYEQAKEYPYDYGQWWGIRKTELLN